MANKLATKSPKNYPKKRPDNRNRIILLNFDLLVSTTIRIISPTYLDT